MSRLTSENVAKMSKKEIAKIRGELVKLAIEYGCDDYDIADFSKSTVVIARRLAKATGKDVTFIDLMIWYSGANDSRGNYKYADEALKAFFGADFYNELDCAARLSQAIEYAFGITEESCHGGIDFVKPFKLAGVTRVTED